MSTTGNTGSCVCLDWDIRYYRGEKKRNNGNRNRKEELTKAELCLWSDLGGIADLIEKKRESQRPVQLLNLVVLEQAEVDMRGSAHF